MCSPSDQLSGQLSGQPSGQPMKTSVGDGDQWFRYYLHVNDELVTSYEVVTDTTDSYVRFGLIFAKIRLIVDRTARADHMTYETHVFEIYSLNRCKFVKIRCFDVKVANGSHIRVTRSYSHAIAHTRDRVVIQYGHSRPADDRHSTPLLTANNGTVAINDTPYKRFVANQLVWVYCDTQIWFPARLIDPKARPLPPDEVICQRRRNSKYLIRLMDDNLSWFWMSSDERLEPLGNCPVNDQKMLNTSNDLTVRRDVCKAFLTALESQTLLD